VSVGLLVALVILVFAGGALQRIAGMGFGMVVAPLALFLLPGQQGVVFTNVLSMVAALVLIWPMRALIEWRRFGLITGGSIVGAAGGATLVSVLQVDAFKVVVGVILLVAIAASFVVRRLTWRAPETSTALAAGTATGALVAISGIGGPPMTIYAVTTRWAAAGFAATMQPFIAVCSAVGAAAVLIAAPEATPMLPLRAWLLVAAALLIGLAIGQLLSRKIPARAATWIIIVLGVVGAASAIINGALSLLMR
jgi:uncharacterized membrane protein YfcA